MPWNREESLLLLKPNDSDHHLTPDRHAILPFLLLPFRLRSLFLSHPLPLTCLFFPFFFHSHRSSSLTLSLSPVPFPLILISFLSLPPLPSPLPLSPPSPASSTEGTRRQARAQGVAGDPHHGRAAPLVASHANVPRGQHGYDPGAEGDAGILEAGGAAIGVGEEDEVRRGGGGKRRDRGGRGGEGRKREGREEDDNALRHDYAVWVDSVDSAASLATRARLHGHGQVMPLLTSLID